MPEVATAIDPLAAWTRSPLGAIVEERSRLEGDRTFLYFRDQEISFRQFDEAANRVANGLAARGVKKGDKVAIMLPNCPEFLYTVFGAAKLGAVEVPLNTGLRGNLLQYILNHCDASLLVLGEEFLDQICFVAPDLTCLEHIVLRGDSLQRTKKPAWRFSTTCLHELMEHRADPPAVEVRHSDLFAIIYTSGTTGPPKGVMLPHHHVFYIAQQRQQRMKIARDEVLYTCLPLFHNNAQFITATTAWICGAQLALAERFSVSQFWDDIRRYRATQFNLMGSMMTALYKQPPSTKDADHCARLTIAVPVPAEIYHEFEQRFHVTIVEGFGMSEAVPVLFNSPEARKPTSCGLPICGFDAMVVDEDDREAPPDTLGELVFRPTQPFSMMTGYYKMPEETLHAFCNFWFHSGDLMKRDEAGYFYWVDRKRDSIRRRGQNISSWEVETVVNSHPDVVDSAAVAVPSEMTEDDLKVVLVLKPGSKLTPEALVDYLVPRLPRYALPRYIEFAEDLPRTATMRIQKYVLRANWRTPGTWERKEAMPRREAVR